MLFAAFYKQNLPNECNILELFFLRK